MNDELRQLLVYVDSVCSEVAYRYPSRLPPGVAADLKLISERARKFLQQEPPMPNS